MKNQIILLFLISTLGCQTSRAGAPLKELPTLTLSVAPKVETETKSEENKPDIRFAIEKNLIGKTEEQVKGLIGPPKKQTPGCSTNVQGGEISIDVNGYQWSYSAKLGNYSAEMDLCLFHGKVIAQQLQTRIDGNGRIDVRTRSATDHRVIRQLMLDKHKTDKDLLLEEEVEDAPKKDL